MKKIIFLTMLCIIAISPLLADWAFEAGFYFPKDTDLSGIYGIERILQIDDNLDLFLNGSFFYRNVTDDRELDTEVNVNTNTTITKKQRMSDITTSYMPALAGARYYIPDIPANLHIGVAIGWALAWEDVYRASFEYIDENGDPQIAKKVDSIKFYHGFTWQTQVGSFFQISPKAEIYGKVYYNGSVVKRDRTKNDIQTWDEIDMSGLGVSVGLRVRL